MRALLTLTLALSTVAPLAQPARAQAPGAAKLVGRATPAGPGLPAGGFKTAAVQPDGTMLLVAAANPGLDPNDQPLRLVRARTSLVGRGALEVLGQVLLRDPDRHLPFPITQQFTPNRVLTAADLDLRAVQVAPDGTLWLGDAMGPFLLHADATGRLLEPPMPLPDAERPGQEVRSPENPYYEGTAMRRLMNALRAHAKAHGATRTPIFSPYAPVLADHDPATVSPLRVLPGSPSSEVHDVAALQAAGHPVIPFTINDPEAMRSLLALGVRGLISDRPDLLFQAVAAHDANGDGRGGDYLDAEGLIDRRLFDAQGHRGARNLRPESTLPAFEAALDHLMTTLETDCAITKDGVPVLHHDPEISPVLARRFDNGPVHGSIRRYSLQELQAQFDLSRLLPLLPTQLNDRALSPVAVAFAREYGLSGPYHWPSLAQLFRFVRFYEQYYHFGSGRTHPEAGRRWRNAARVHVDLETKTSPTLEALGITPPAETYVRAIAEVVRQAGMEDRTMIQSFDMRTLLVTHTRYPRLQTMLLLGEAPPFGTRVLGAARPTAPGPQNHWHQDVAWPFRQTEHEHPVRLARGVGLSGLGLSPDGRTLYPVLERALVGAAGVPIQAFDLASKQFRAPVGTLPLEPGSLGLPGFVLTGAAEGLVAERAAGAGKVFRVRWDAGGVHKMELADLGRVSDPDGLMIARTAAAAGLGNRTVALPAVMGGLSPVGAGRFGVMTESSGFLVLELEGR